MDTELLRTFVAICDTKSFTSAARHVGRTQSAVSLQMRRLEQFFGRPLFVRGGSGVTLTEHGVLLLDHAREILQKVGAARALFDRGSVEGVVVLGMPDDYAPRILSRVLRGFSELYPAATVNLVIDQSRTLVRHLSDGAVDLAFISEGEGPAGGPVAFRDRMVWVSPEGSDLHMRNPVPIAIWDESNAYALRMFPALKAMNREYRIAIMARNMTGLRGAVTAGLSMTAMMSSSVTSGMRQLDREDGFPPLAELGVRLERAHMRRSPVIDRLESHLLASLDDEAVRSLGN
ncbi:MAG: LysR family transcriptional regulator [Hyphomicrobiaceae bacterium]